MFLWFHVLCGVAWVGACASFVLAASALGSEPGEVCALALRTAPRINRLSAPLVFIIPLTGIGNLLFAARAHGFVLPAQFLGILAVKVVLLLTMALALWRARRAVVSIDAHASNDGQRSAAVGLDIRELINSYGVILGAGVAALALGFWLSGI